MATVKSKKKNAPAAASLPEVAKSTLTICQLWLATKLVAI